MQIFFFDFIYIRRYIRVIFKDKKCVNSHSYIDVGVCVYVERG
jgi:hypothetical protein